VVQLEYLDVTVLRLGVGEVRVVAGELQHADKCGGECSTGTRTESKRIPNHNTPQLSRMDLANHCAAFPGLSLLNTRAVLSVEIHPTFVRDLSAVSQKTVLSDIVFKVSFIFYSHRTLFIC
jgi:hypothetical protein